MTITDDLIKETAAGYPGREAEVEAVLRASPPVLRNAAGGNIRRQSQGGGMESGLYRGHGRTGLSAKQRRELMAAEPGGMAGETAMNVSLRDAVIQAAATLKVSARWMQSVYDLKAASAPAEDREAMRTFIEQQRKAAAELEDAAARNWRRLNRRTANARNS